MSPRYRRLLCTFTIAAPTFVQPACTSIVTKLYDTDNYTSSEPQKKCLRGIPITMDVPTHVKIVITETQYWYQVKEQDAKGGAATSPTTSPPPGGTDAANAKPDDTKKKDSTPAAPAVVAPAPAVVAPAPAVVAPAPAVVAPAPTGVTTVLEAEGVRYVPTLLQPTRSADYNIITKKDLFTVDFKRPAAGTNDLKIKFANPTSSGQYPSAISQTVQDITIQEVAALIQQVIQSAPTVLSKGASVTSLVTPNVIEVPTVVAVEFFDIHEPNLEGRIREFLDKHINSCSPNPCQKGNQGPLIAPLVSGSPSQLGSSPTTGSVAPTSGVQSRTSTQRVDAYGNLLR